MTGLPTLVSAPGVKEKSCMLVKSASGAKPHFVRMSGKSKYKCDGDGSFMSFHKHTL